jgi:hypothetical protein
MKLEVPWSPDLGGEIKSMHTDAIFDGGFPMVYVYSVPNNTINPEDCVVFSFITSKHEGKIFGVSTGSASAGNPASVMVGDYVTFTCSLGDTIYIKDGVLTTDFTNQRFGIAIADNTVKRLNFTD